jgi:hypothetical protein
MAIKGKGRTRGRRMVAAPPRPQLVVRKPPMWRRPWILIVVGVLAAGGILTAVLISIHSGNVRKLKDREAAAVGTVAQQFVAQFPPDRQAVQNLYLFYPALSGDLDKLPTGELSATDADAEAQTLLDSATKASAGIAKVNVEKLIPTSFTVSHVAGAHGKGLTRAELVQARFLMQRAFDIYASMATVMRAAVEAKDAKQTALIDDLKQMANQASDLFAQGWQILVGIETRLGIQAPAA